MNKTKKIICAVISLIMLITSVCVPVVAEDGEVTVGNTYSEMRLVDANGEYLYYDLVFHDAAQLGVTAMGFDIDYPDNLTLVDCEEIYEKGSFTMSPTIDVKPYKVLWVWGLKNLPFEEVVLVRLKFKVAHTVEMDDKVEIDLSFAENSEPSGLEGEKYTEEIETPTTPPPADFSEIVESFPDFQPKSAVIFDEAIQLGKELVLGLYMDPAEESESKSIMADIVCPEGIILKNVESVMEGAEFAQDGNTLSWTVADGKFSSDKTLIANLTFEIAEDVEKLNVSEIGIDVKKIESTSSEDITYDFVGYNYTFDPAKVMKSVVISEDSLAVKHNPTDDSYMFIGGVMRLRYWNDTESEEIPLVDCEIIDVVQSDDAVQVFTAKYGNLRFDAEVANVCVAGDVDGNKSVNLDDVIHLLKNIAGWPVDVDVVISDVTGDGKADINDVTHLLKYIAGWNVSFS